MYGPSYGPQATYGAPSYTPPVTYAQGLLTFTKQLFFNVDFRLRYPDTSEQSRVIQLLRSRLLAT